MYCATWLLNTDFGFMLKTPSEQNNQSIGLTGGVLSLFFFLKKMGRIQSHSNWPDIFCPRPVNRAQIVAPLWYWALGVMLDISFRPHLLQFRWEYFIKISHVSSTGDTHWVLITQSLLLSEIQRKTENAVQFDWTLTVILRPYLGIISSLLHDKTVLFRAN